MGITAELLARMTIRKTGSQDFGGPQFDALIEQRLQFVDGVAAGQADLAWADERAVASATNDDIDLAGALSDAFGVTITAAELVALLIVNKPRLEGAAANTTNLTVGLGTNPVTPGFMGGTTPTFGPIRPGGFLFFGADNVAGFGVVTGGAADVLRVANSAGAIANYQIGALFRTA